MTLSVRHLQHNGRVIQLNTRLFSKYDTNLQQNVTVNIQKASQQMNNVVSTPDGHSLVLKLLKKKIGKTCTAQL